MRVIAFLALFSLTAAAQWPSYLPPGIPRLPDGKPNLAAPAPRTAAGKPDLSGMWHVEGSGRVNGLTWNVAQDLAPEEVQPWARALYRDRLLSFGKDGPMARCLPRGLVPLNAFGAVFSRIVQTPEVTVIVYGGDGAGDALRTIFTNGRSLPKDPNPAWLGYSIGHWESDTLVVTTTGFNDRGWLDFYGHPQTESLRVTERFRRLDFGHLEFEMTLEDPTVFTRPVSLRMDKVLVPDTELPETICENEKDAGHLVGGNGFRLSQEQLARYAGIYEFAPGREVTLTVADGHLLFQEGRDGVRRALVPQSEILFMFRDNGDGIEFSKGAVEFVARGRGSNQKAVRKGAGPDVPRTWDEAAIATLEVPLANPIGSPKHASSDYYYRIPVAPIYKNYPVYVPGREPAGYFERLKQQEPEIVWDDAGHHPPLETEADWIKAGELVFDTPVKSGLLMSVDDVRSPAWYTKTGWSAAGDGTLPIVR